jgi:hypothetical protein
VRGRRGGRARVDRQFAQLTRDVRERLAGGSPTGRGASNRSTPAKGAPGGKRSRESEGTHESQASRPWRNRPMPARRDGTRRVRDKAALSDAAPGSAVRYWTCCGSTTRSVPRLQARRLVKHSRWRAAHQSILGRSSSQPSALRGPAGRTAREHLVAEGRLALRPGAAHPRVLAASLAGRSARRQGPGRSGGRVRSTQRRGGVVVDVDRSDRTVDAAERLARAGRSEAAVGRCNDATAMCQRDLAIGSDVRHA